MGNFFLNNMTLTRKEIMLLTNKEKAFHEISMHTDWSNHRKAAERSSWRKKHEPEKIKKCPNRGKRYTKKVQEEEEDPPCTLCKKPSDGYDFPCKHPICHPCFQHLFLQTNGHMDCPVCKQEFIFYDELVDEND